MKLFVFFLAMMAITVESFAIDKEKFCEESSYLAEMVIRFRQEGFSKEDALSNISVLLDSGAVNISFPASVLKQAAAIAADSVYNIPAETFDNEKTKEILPIFGREKFKQECLKLK